MRLAIALSGIALVGCNAIFGTDGLVADEVPIEGGGGATATGTSTTGTTSTTSGGGAAPEVCLNGRDDDANGLADCEDPACGAYECIPGSDVALAYVALGPDSECPVDAPAVELSSCEACACQGFAGNCAVDIDLFSDTACANYSDTVDSGGGCKGGFDGDQSVKILNAMPQNASCLPSSPLVNASVQSACRSLETGSCADASSVCVPSLPEAAPRCILVAPSEGCPLEYPSLVEQVYEGNHDTCGCACASSPGCDPVVIHTASTNQCLATTPTTIPPATCVQVAPFQSLMIPQVGATAGCSVEVTDPPPEGRRLLCCAMGS